MVCSQRVNSAKSCGRQPLRQGCSWKPQSTGLSPSPYPQLRLSGLSPSSPCSAHPQPEVDGGEQSFAGWAGEVPPAKGLLELGRYANELGGMALGRKRVGLHRGPEDQGVGQRQRQRQRQRQGRPQETQAGGPQGPVRCPLPARPGAALAGRHSRAGHRPAS